MPPAYPGPDVGLMERVRTEFVVEETSTNEPRMALPHTETFVGMKGRRLGSGRRRSGLFVVFRAQRTEKERHPSGPTRTAC